MSSPGSTGAGHGGRGRGASDGIGHGHRVVGSSIATRHGGTGRHKMIGVDPPSTAGCGQGGGGQGRGQISGRSETGPPAWRILQGIGGGIGHLRKRSPLSAELATMSGSSGQGEGGGSRHGQSTSTSMTPIRSIGGGHGQGQGTGHGRIMAWPRWSAESSRGTHHTGTGGSTGVAGRGSSAGGCSAMSVRVGGSVDG